MFPYPLGIGFVAGLGGLEHLAQTIDRTQQNVGILLGDLALAVAHLIEQGFHDVGEVGNGLEAEGAGTALDRMGGAEDAVDGFAVGAARFQFHQAGFHHLQSLEAFFEEDLMKLSHIDGHGACLCCCCAPCI